MDVPSDQRAPGSSGGAVPLIAMLVGVIALVIGGVVLLLTVGSGSFGWFAYAPVADMAYRPDGTFISRLGWVGILVAALGLASLSFGFGIVLGRRWPRTDGH